MRLLDLEFFRGKASEAAAVHEAPDHVVLAAEDEWFVAGAAADLAELARALPGSHVRPVNGRLRMKFINEVGRFAIPGCGILELSSRKWRERDFDAMLADLARIAAGLPFAERQGPGVAMTNEHVVDEASLYHAFIYLRQILSPAAPRSEQLTAAITAILAEPHERLVQEQRPVPLHAAHGVSVHALQRLVTRGGSWERAAPGAVSPAWERTYGAVVPRTLDSSVARPSRDTAENRFVKHFLAHIRAIVRVISERTNHGDATFRKRLAQDARQMLVQIDGLLLAPLWRGVGELSQVPAGSTVLQRRHGYADILRHDTRMRCLARISALRELWRDLIAVKQVSRLYEIWCFFAVVETLKAWLGEPVHASVTREADFTASLPEGVEVIWPGGVRALYNPTFPQPAGPGGRRSYSVELRPDICVVMPHGLAPGLYIFDAKFAREIEHDSAKTSDLHKMHVYRDALRMRGESGPAWRVRSAWALFPGEQDSTTAWPAEDDLPAVAAGVGAISLRPGVKPDGGGRGPLLAVLGAMLGRA